MKLEFRQGIVQYQSPSFLNIGSNTVGINVVDTPTIIAIADGPANYLFTELISVPNAWVTLPGVDQWLYWDIDRFNARRTFGVTLHDPVVQAVEPPPGLATRPVDKHWFDTVSNTMKVWNGSAWIERIRVFACKLVGGTVAVSPSINSPSSFAGTQVGIEGPSFAGEILFDSETGLPYRTNDGRFLTSETPLTVRNAMTSYIKTAALQLEATALISMTAFTVVRFSDFGKITYADQFTAGQQQFGIIVTDVAANNQTMVITTGNISNSTWNWPTVNQLLYSNEIGELVSTPPVPSAVPVATVIDKQTILVGSPHVTITGGGGGGTVSPATTTALGTVRISVPAVNPAIPIAAGTNDPRIVNALNRTGDTMTGALVLNGAPVNPLEAATKQYVDDAVSGGSLVYPLEAPDGSEASPSYSFENSLGTGFSLDAGSSPNALVVSFEGSETVRINTGVDINLSSDFETVQNGNFSQTNDAVKLSTVLRTTTTDAIPTILMLDGPGGSQVLTLPDNATWRYEIDVVAQRTAGGSEQLTCKVSGAITRGAGASTTGLIGSPIKVIDATTSPAWNVGVAANVSSGSLDISVTGEIGKSIRWVAYLAIVQVILT